MSKGNLIVVSGPSGAGKGTLVAATRKRVPDLFLSVSATTRRPRRGEIEGVSYRFIDRETFEGMRRRGEFLECAHVHHNLYGTPLEPVKRQLEAGKDVLLEIDVQGALQAKKKFPEAHLVFIMPPSIDELHNRLAKRKSEDEEDVQQRIRVAKHEILLAPKYDYVVTNDDVARATNELVGIIKEIRRLSREKKK